MTRDEGELEVDGPKIEEDHWWVSQSIGYIGKQVIWYLVRVEVTS